MLGWDTGHDYVPSRQSTATTFAQQNPAMRSFVTEVGTAQSRTADLGTKYPEGLDGAGDRDPGRADRSTSPESALAQAQQQATSTS